METFNQLVDLVAKEAKISKKAAKTAVLTVEHSVAGEMSNVVLVGSLEKYTEKSFLQSTNNYYLMAPSALAQNKQTQAVKCLFVENAQLESLPNEDILRVDDIISVVKDCCTELKQKLTATNEKMDKLVEERKTFWQEIEYLNGEIAKNVQ